MPRLARLAAPLLTVMLLAGCANFSGTPLQPGSSTLADLDRAFGAPALRWVEADGGERRAYPTGPMGYKTWMARTDAAGRLVSPGPKSYVTGRLGGDGKALQPASNTRQKAAAALL